MIVYLEPQAPFTKSAPRSDTLFGACCWAIRMLYGNDELERLLLQFDDASSEKISPPFILSSSFPYLQYGGNEGQKILFLPKPLLPPRGDQNKGSTHDYTLTKKFRKVQFLSHSIFNQVIEGKIDDEKLLVNLLESKQPEYAIVGDLLITRSEAAHVKRISKVAQKDEIARNAITRLSNTTSEGGSLFYEPIISTKESHFHNLQSGYYFLVKTANIEIAKMIKAAARFLGDKGFGGDSSVGRGYATVNFDDNTASFIKEINNGDRAISLSLLYPNRRDRQYFIKHQDHIYAKLERRKGFVESYYLNNVAQVWKPTLFMMQEGATFPHDSTNQTYGSAFIDQRKMEEQDFALRINGFAYIVQMKGEANR